ncbi:MAG: cytochrome P450 [Anaerolineales bacterium]|nr:cytochrome P450 [Anaerolineales bacterium]
MHTQAQNTYPPGPKLPFPWQFIGRPFANLPDTFLNLAAQYGDIVHFMLGRQHIYLINHPDFIQEVLITQQRNFTKGRVLQNSRQLLGNGLLTAEGEAHIQQRRMVQPIFHREQINKHIPQIIQLAEEMSLRWQANQPLDLSAEMTRLTMNIIAQALFGTTIDAQTPALSNAIQVLLTTPHAVLRRIRAGSNKREFQRSQAHLTAFIETSIAEHKNGAGQSDILSQLLHATDGQGCLLGQQQIQDHAMTFFLAGHETIASALSWTFYLLAQYPQIAEKLSAELDSVLVGYSPSAENYSQLEYTKMALTESMRLYPPAWIMGRQAQQDVTLGGYHIPQGATVLLSQWVTHHDPRFYPNPELYKPERWLPAARAVRPKMAYFPFGGGQRLCIGEHFAWMVGILTIATVMQTWRFKQIPGRRMTPEFTVTLRSPNGFYVRPVPIKL